MDHVDFLSRLNDLKTTKKSLSNLEIFEKYGVKLDHINNHENIFFE